MQKENDDSTISSSSSSSSSCNNCPNNNNTNNSENSENISLNSTLINNIFKNNFNNNTNKTNNIFNSRSNTFPPISNKINIDVAVLCQEYTKIEKMCDDNIINLDEIEITKDLFQYIFYPYCETFGINKNTICNNSAYLPYISFLPEYRTVDGKKFYLLEAIITNIEADLNVSRNCFTIDSLVELTNEIISINSLCDLNCCSVLSSLTWSNILEIIKNYEIINCDCTSITEPVIPICVISVIFKTPTPGVKNTIVRFNYRITDL
jgi:hypothetical protein